MINRDKEFSDDPDYLALSDEEKQRIVSVMEKMLKMGIGAVYGLEDEDVPDADVDCEERIRQCNAICCTYTFALTKEEVQKGRIKHDAARPFFIARDADGYCPHLDRSTIKCTVWAERPLRCRRYDCRKDSQVWPEGGIRDVVE